MVGTRVPKRIQLRRSRGWRLPAGAVKVDRTTPWGNPFIVSPRARPGAGSGVGRICVPTVEDAVACFEIWASEQPEFLTAARAELAGRDLACWCKVGAPCHADVLLRMVNSGDA